MVRQLPLLLCALVLTGLVAAPPAGAVGIGGARAVAAPKASAPPGGQLIAPPAACPGQEDLAAPPAAQEEAMACMVDFARRGAGLEGLSGAPALAQSAEDKSLDVLRCDA